MEKKDNSGSRVKRIYAAAAAAGLSTKSSARDDDLHLMILGRYGRESVKELSCREAEELCGILDGMTHRAQAAAKAPAQRKRKPGFLQATDKPGGLTFDQQSKVWALMYELKKYDADPEKSAPVGKRLCALIKKQLKVDASPKDPFRWLDGEQGFQLIEILKRLVGIEEEKAGAAHG